MKRLLRTATGIHVWLYRATNGRIGGQIKKAPILLLTTIGRTTGRARTTPLSYLEVGKTIAICGANLGSDRPPGWLRNLDRDPHFRVRIGGEEFTALARIAELEERDVLWTRMIHQLPALRTYQARTDRVLPVIVLEPNNQHPGP
ncbi:MAG: nitroreductase family deazaflavin-dependent oxidoreductase [Acidimicrobiia bacterium]|nr:nitroreductase family deazaflavin-dependent oxidoreductase [Acidimicrobiia bacterium]